MLNQGQALAGKTFFAPKQHPPFVIVRLTKNAMQTIVTSLTLIGMCVLAANKLKDAPNERAAICGSFYIWRTNLSCDWMSFREVADLLPC